MGKELTQRQKDTLKKHSKHHTTNEKWKVIYNCT